MSTGSNGSTSRDAASSSDTMLAVGKHVNLPQCAPAVRSKQGGCFLQLRRTGFCC
jgi:hypothetical protein